MGISKQEKTTAVKDMCTCRRWNQTYYSSERVYNMVWIINQEMWKLNSLGKELIHSTLTVLTELNSSRPILALVKYSSILSDFVFLRMRFPNYTCDTLAMMTALLSSGSYNMIQVEVLDSTNISMEGFLMMKHEKIWI